MRSISALAFIFLIAVSSELRAQSPNLPSQPSDNILVVTSLNAIVPPSRLRQMRRRRRRLNQRTSLIRSCCWAM